MSETENLFEEGDPFDDPLWQEASRMGGAAPKPAAGYVTCPLAWLARVLPVAQTSAQLAVALVLYRRCLMKRGAIVSFPNGELAELGVGRTTKYRALARLKAAGAVTIETRNGRPLRVTLHWFP